MLRLIAVVRSPRSRAYALVALTGTRSTTSPDAIGVVSA